MIVIAAVLNPAKIQVFVEPFGLLWFALSDTVCAVQDYCSGNFFGGKVRVTLRINMWQPPLEATIADIVGQGVMRVSAYPLKGGALTVSAAGEMVQTQLVAHGAKMSHAKSTSDHLVQTVGCCEKGLGPQGCLGTAQGTCVQIEYCAYKVP